jgi:hypothetical protein
MIQNHRKIHTIILSSFLLAMMAGLLLVIASVLPFASASTPVNLENATLLTPNQIAAGGPIPPNYTLVQQEAECIAGKDNAPWYQTMLGYERGDSNRTGLYECATFTGSFTGPNQVFAYRSPDRYYTPAIMVTRGTNEMYIYGGSNAASDPVPTSSYVARIEPGTLKELWRTVLINTNISDPWTGVGGLESLGGNLFAVTNSYLYKLNGTTGEVEGMLTLPTGASLPNNSYFNGMGGWPDGTLVMKNLARAPGCTLQGFFALAKCPNLEDTPPSALVAVDSKTFKVLDWVQLEQMIGGRVTATQYHGKDYAYLPGTTELYRYEWNGQNLTLDKSWGPVSYLLPNQTAASACGIMEDYVVCQTNGQPSNVSLSVFAVSQANSSKLTRIEPMPLEPGQVSYIPSLPAFDPENNRIYAMDPGPGKAAAVNLDQETGNMTLAWSVDEKTLEWMVLIGPADQRVFVGTNILTNITNPLDYNVGPIGANYKEQIQWRDANTGKLLAVSDYFSPMINGFQMWPGYGGLIYEGLNEGHIMALKVLPATNETSTAAATMTSTTKITTTGQNSTSAAG